MVSYYLVTENTNYCEEQTYIMKNESELDDYITETLHSIGQYDGDILYKILSLKNGEKYVYDKDNLDNLTFTVTQVEIAE